jgi:hypothetical protein
MASPMPLLHSTLVANADASLVAARTVDHASYLPTPDVQVCSLWSVLPGPPTQPSWWWVRPGGVVAPSCTWARQGKQSSPHDRATVVCRLTIQQQECHDLNGAYIYNVRSVASCPGKQRGYRMTQFE